MWVVIWAALAQAGVTVTLPGTDTEVVFETAATSEVEGAMADLSARKFDDATRRFGALADASNNADLRYLQAISAYEGGQMRLADQACTQGLAANPAHAPLLSLRGLVLADLGKGDEALASLDKAAAARPDPGLGARIALNRGVVHLDRGEATFAFNDFTEARSMAEKLGDTATSATATDNLLLVAALRGGAASASSTDPMGAVADKLRKGDVAGAKSALPAAPADRRGNVRFLIAKANIARAEGRLDDAVASLVDARRLAEEGGLVRERAATLAQLGVVYGVAGKYDLAVDLLQEAITLVTGTSFRTNELTYRVEAGRMSVHQGDTLGAEGQLAVGRKLAPQLEDPLGVARLDELEGLILAKKGNLTAAAVAFDRAIAVFDGRGDWAEAARIAAGAVEVAVTDPAALTKAEKRATDLFVKAGDPLGPAHVKIAEGLGQAHQGYADQALRSFAEAAKAAEAQATKRGAQVAVIAREDAAQTLLSLGRSADSAAKAKEFGLEQVLADHEKYEVAKAGYETARKAFDQGRWAEARTGFDSAYTALTQIGELGYADKARRGRAWATYNATVGKPPAEAFPVWQGLIEEATLLRDLELRARAMGAGALDGAELGRKEALLSLRAAGDEAERMGLVTLAGQVLAKRSTLEPALDDRVAAARRAWGLSANATGVYAMYAVAVDLYNADRYAEARSIADEILPHAGALATQVTEVRDAARDAAP